MDYGIGLLSTNLSVSFEWIVFIIGFFTCFIFFALSFQIGLIILFLGFASLFAWMYTLQLNYLPFLIMTFISFVMMCLSLYISNKSTTRGAYI